MLEFDSALSFDLSIIFKVRTRSKDVDPKEKVESGVLTFKSYFYYFEIAVNY